MAQSAPRRLERQGITLAQFFDAEFPGRHNVRPLDSAGQMVAVVRGADGKRLRYVDLAVG